MKTIDPLHLEALYEAGKPIRFFRSRVIFNQGGVGCAHRGATARDWPWPVKCKASKIRDAIAKGRRAPTSQSPFGVA